jgi:hypothetical protein
MATPRRRNSGFSAEVTEKPQEEMEVTTPVDPVSEEVICDQEEVTEEKEEQPEKVVESAPVVFESIAPAADSGPRFIEKETPEEIAKVAPQVESAPSLLHPPKRSPRNIPKFSRHK